MLAELKTFEITVLFRQETIDDIEYYIAPCVALVPGVRNGSLIEIDTLSKTVEQWNNTPLMLNHPKDINGNYILADAKEAKKFDIGVFKYPKIEDNRLKGECWVDVEKCAKLPQGDTLLGLIENGSPIECSIGFLAIFTEKIGNFNGVEYNEVIDYIAPDHLALLPNDRGACSWDDGCGFGRILQKRNGMDKPLNFKEEGVKRLQEIAKGLMTDADLYRNLSHLVSADMSEWGYYDWEWYIEGIESDSDNKYITVSLMRSLWRREYSKSEDGALTLMGEWEPVQVETTFIPMESQCSCKKLENLTEEETMTDTIETPQVDTLAVFLQEQNTTKEEIIMALLDSRMRREGLVKQVLTIYAEKVAGTGQAPISEEALQTWPDAALEAVIEANQRVLVSAPANPQPGGVYPRHVPESSTGSQLAVASNGYAPRPKMKKRGE